MKIEADPQEVITRESDSRGRITLGSDYSNSDVTVVILDVEE